MANEHIDAGLLHRMILTAEALVRRNKDQLNALNVFPVPDGDTGHNMHLTLKAVLDAWPLPDATLADALAALADGSLRGARGNSGVILSQYFRGFAQACDGEDVIEPARFAAALQAGAAAAYDAVMQPAEGTILTVARGAAEAVAGDADGRSLAAVIDAAVAGAQHALAQTPSLLPVLQRAGVVDAGGQGLVYVLQGFAAAIRGEDAACSFATDGAREGEGAFSLAAGGLSTRPAVVDAAGGRTGSAQSGAAATQSMTLSREDAEMLLRYPYDIELLILKERVDTAALRQRLERLGDSVLVIAGRTDTKVHVHTDRPVDVIATCLEHGPIHDVQILNMRRQYEQTWRPDPHDAAAAAAQSPPAEVAVVSVVPGPGFARLFESVGCAATIQGGSADNPSTEELAAGVNAVAAKHIVLLPNHKNIVPAAEQVRHLTTRSVTVLPTHSPQAGLAAMLAWQPDRTLDENLAAMRAAVEQVTTGAVTHAVRDAVIEERSIRRGQALGFAGDRLVAVADSLERAVLDTLAAMVDAERHAVITVFSGRDVTHEDVEALAGQIAAAFPELELERHEGGQAHYPYLLMVE